MNKFFCLILLIFSNQLLAQNCLVNLNTQSESSFDSQKTTQFLISSLLTKGFEVTNQTQESVISVTMNYYTSDQQLINVLTNPVSGTHIKSLTLVSTQGASATVQNEFTQNTTPHEDFIFLAEKALSNISFCKMSKILVSEITTPQQYANIIITLSKGNSLKKIPEIPSSSLINNIMSRFSVKKHFDGYDAETEAKMINIYTDKFRKTLKKLKSEYETNDFSLTEEIKIAGELYGIDPTHIIAAIIGEHTFNVGLEDKFQNLIVKSKKWSDYLPDRNDLLDIVNDPIMDECRQEPTDYDKFYCMENIWLYKIAGKTYKGKTYEFYGFIGTFFDPNKIGTTYGLGQMSPYKALILSDRVSQVSGFAPLSLERQKEIYQAVINPKMTVHYMAALMRATMDYYKSIARFDISKNIGITSTLYNLGFEKNKAVSLYSDNVKNLRNNKALRFPQVNYYGWFINNFENEIRAVYGL